MPELDGGVSFTRRGDAWRLDLLPGWDAIEDMMGAALISRQPVEQAGRFRASINVVEVKEPLPQDLHRFAEEQVALLTNEHSEVIELYALPPGSSSRGPGVLVGGAVVRYESPELGLALMNEQTWADADDGSLVFTLVAEEQWYRQNRETMLTVPRSLELGSWFAPH